MKLFQPVFILAAFLAAAGCARNVLPEGELARLNPQKILDLGAEKYSGYDYEDAVYYYASIERLFSQGDGETLDAKAWAKYEIGFIRFQQGSLKEAVQNFEQVLAIKNPSAAPRILATQMLDRLRKKK